MAAETSLVKSSLASVALDVMSYLTVELLVLVRCANLIGMCVTKG